jgi:hypothetical protein
MLNQEQKEFLKETVDSTIRICRNEVDEELVKLKVELDSHKITTELAESIATNAAIKAKKMMTEDIKLEIADASISVIKRALQVISLFLIGMMFWISSKKWPWS